MALAEVNRLTFANQIKSTTCTDLKRFARNNSENLD